MELKIYSPSEDGFLKSIEFNHEELKKELQLKLEKYKGLVYSDEEIKLAKADKANLNKFITAIEEKRKEIKRQCLRPYDEFEIKIKEIINLVNAPVNEIDTQIKAYETKLQNEKKEEITGIYNELIGDLKDILPLIKIWNSKWLNVGYKFSAITEEIAKEVEKVKNDLVVIEGLKSEFETEIKNKYLETLLLSEAIALKSKLEEQKKKLEEYKNRQNEIKAAALLKEQANPQIISNPVSTTPTTQSINQELEMLEFRVWVTQEQKKLLREFILTNKIKCGKAGK